jgi:hypothetical protein
MLDSRCSKILYTIWSQDRVAKRQLDWIYRNIPGAKVHCCIPRSICRNMMNISFSMFNLAGSSSNSPVRNRSRFAESSHAQLHV